MLAWMLLLGLALADTDTGHDDGEGGGAEQVDPGDGVEDGPRFVADAGLPFLAYVGDTIILSAEGSRGPGRQPLSFVWRQVAGPQVALSDAGAAQPAFVPDAPGQYVFLLRVGRDGVLSEPARSYVSVVDREVGSPGRGCSQVPVGVGAALLLGVGLMRRRRSPWQAVGVSACASETTRCRPRPVPRPR